MDFEVDALTESGRAIHCQAVKYVENEACFFLNSDAVTSGKENLLCSNSY
jgi:hypothetical protein